MTNSQNTKNEKDCIKQNEKSFIQKDLSLTELWQKGELPEGHYYVKDGENLIAEYLDGYFYNNGEPMTSFSGGVDEVLAPVPSYEEWKQMNKWCEEFNALNLVKENEKLKEELSRESYKVSEAYCFVEELKELLKKARDILEDEGDYMIVQKIDEELDK